MKRFLALSLLFIAGAFAAPSRWTKEKAALWYARQPWLVGSNYIPATAINELEMWQADTFDPQQIDKELGWAESLGMNTMRVFLHDLLWQQDSAGFKNRIDTFLQIAARHKIRPIFVLFDSCWDPFPKLGPQHPPVPGVHNSGWVQSPGSQALVDPAEYPRLEAYVKGVVGAFARDDRILAWDIWNEPDNLNDSSYGGSEPPNKIALVQILLPKAFAWARSGDPEQPLSSGVWQGNWSSPAKLSPIARIQLQESDVISFHNYDGPKEFTRRVRWLRRYRRPVLCTEYMARGNGSTFQGILPVAKRYKVAAINWGFVAGKTQTNLPWDSWQKPYTDREPPIWFHEIFYPDGKPYREDEVRFIRQMTGESAARVLFLVPGKAPRSTMPSRAKTLDCRPFGAIAFHIASAADGPVVLHVAVRDAAGAVSEASFKLRARGDAAVAVPLDSPDPLEMGMRGEPAIPGYRLASSDHHKIDSSHVVSIALGPPGGATADQLHIDDVKLIPGVTYDKIVDPLGQFARADWPGKIKSPTEFAKRRAAEETAIAANPRLPERDEYGGWSAGPDLPASGFFRATKRDGKWWLVTPGGHLFLSFGADSINTTEGDTITQGREQMFQWLPAQDDPLASHYSENRDWEALGLKIRYNMGRSFNFYAANLERKYGKDWYAAWQAATLARLPAWGMNTIGNWSDTRLYAAKKLPYTVTIDPWPAVTGDRKSQFAEVASGNDYWKRMADPFDPRYAAALDRGTREQALAHRDDPWCLGYFIDNEMSWGSMKDDRSRYGLALGTLALKAGSPAKGAFVASLKAKYGDIAKLNQAWGTALDSWQALLDNPLQPSGELGAGMQEDLRVFSREFARQYFRTVAGILKKYDPNHLYLGPRFAWHTRESVEACGELCDVVSFNIYRPKVAPSEWTMLDGIDKPVLIGEFHMGALDRGMFHTGLVPAEDQADRARMYQEYIRSVVDHPLMVGCHYFKYADEPLTGRPGDGENYNIGLVSVTDTPYAELIEAARIVHAEAYRRRGAGPRPAAASQAASPEAERGSDAEHLF